MNRRDIFDHPSLAPLGEGSRMTGAPSGEKAPPVMEDTVLLTALARAMDPSLWEQVQSEPGSIRPRSVWELPDEVVVPPFLDGQMVERVAPDAFRGSNVRKVTVPEGVREIGAYAFTLCSQLEELILPNSLRKLAYGCLACTPRLSRLVLPADYREESSLRELKQSGLAESCRITYREPQDYQEAVFPAGLRRVGEKAFANCHTLRRAVLPEEVEEVGAHAFFDCEELAQLSLPASLRRIGPQAFAFCSSLTEVLLPDSLESLGKQAFWFCGLLRRAEFPASWSGRQEEIEAAGFPESCRIVFR